MTPSGISVKILLLCFFVKDSFGKPYNATMRIIQGSEINIERIPWQISLQQEVENKRLWFKCGGVIIGKDQVLTAAHCLEGKESAYYVRAGVSNRNEGGPMAGNNDYYVQKVIKHPEYHFSSCRIDRDIAFLKLAKSFKFGRNVQPIQLADADPKNGEKVMVTGWGKTNPKWETRPSFPENLHHINISVWDKKSCFDNFKIPDVLKGKDDIKCLSNQKSGGFQSVCDGDSGSPVVESGSKKLVGLVTGIVSSQITLPPNRPCAPLTIEEISKLVCNDKKTVSVYNSIVPHRDWIKKVMKENS